jgi:predicted nucleic-acid-binding protein
MVTVDINVLARAILHDDPGQTPRAQELLRNLARQEGVFVPFSVVLELSWLLRSRRKSRKEIAAAVRLLLDSAGVTVGNVAIVAKALELSAGAGVGFEDCLILAESLAAGSRSLSTFDRELAAAHPHCACVE